MKRNYIHTIFKLVIVCFLVSCSTTKLVPQGEYRLRENIINITNSKDYPASDLKSYVKQSPNNYYFLKWNPRLYIYNWGDGSNSGWDKFVRRIGEEPVVFDSTKIESSKEAMISHLEYLGYYNSTVSDTVIYKNRNATVKYNVTLGKQYPLNEINYIIPDTVMASIISKDSASIEIHKGKMLSESALESESERMAQLLRNNGYYGFTKNYFFYFADTTKVKDKANLLVKLENYTRNESSQNSKEHAQYRIAQVNIRPQNNLKVNDNFLSQINRLSAGSLYDESAVANTYGRFSSVPLFSNVNVQLSEIDSAQVECNIRLTPAKLQGVKFNLESSINSNALLGVSPSLSYTHKNIFGSGEMLSLGFMGNFQFKFNDKVRSNEFGVSAGLSFPEFLGLPERLFPGNLPQTEFNISYNYQDRPEYTRNIISTSFGYRFDVNKRFYYQIYPIQLNMVRLFNIDQSFFDNLKDPLLHYSYKNHLDLGLGGTLYYTTDNSINPRNSYFYFRCQLDMAGNLLSLFNNYMDSDQSNAKLIWGVPYSQFIRGEMTGVYTYKFGFDNRFSLATRLNIGAGYAYGNSTALPFERLFYAGGANSMRGWQTRSVGPGTAPTDSTFTIASQAGDMKIEGNVEFRFPLFWKLGAALFYDLGNVWNIPRSLEGFFETEVSEEYRGEFNFNNLSKSFASSWGVGLRLDFNSILVRVDWGFKGFDPSIGRWVKPREWFGAGGSAFHFGIGLPF